MYHGQITALLGHNGAGKSTTFSMLTGVTAPSSGTAYIDDYDIRTNLPQIRKRTGLCPQYNILFNSLTVIEHLEFFCKLKGREYFVKEAVDLLKRLKIDFKMTSRAGVLSGGQKRKLSLAIALIGGSEIVMLDEPTSGMDPGARHETWTLLQAEKSKRTILLTTHFMEEADLLGDRIAILAHGQLQCCGSGMFLKSQYGNGYHLTVVYENSSKPDEQVTRTMDLLRRYITDIRLQSLVGQEATFIISSNCKAQFSSMFAKLEKIQGKLGISSFGMSVTTMEEVFLKEKTSSKFSNIFQITKDKFSSFVDFYVFSGLKVARHLTGFPYYWQQVEAMFIKRTIYFYRKWIMFLINLLFPILYMALMVWTTKLVPSPTAQPSLKIDLLPFGGSNGDGYLIISNRTDPPFFNNFAFTSAPLAISIADSMTISATLKRNISLKVNNYPFPPVAQDILKNRNISNSAAFIISYAVIVCMSIVVAACSQFLIRERKNKSKHMQMLSGLRCWMYWGTAFVWDVSWYVVEMAAFIGILYIFDIEPYTKDGTTILILLMAMTLYGLTAIPFTYWFSFMFTSAPKGFTLIVMYNIITGMIGSIAVPIIQQTADVYTAFDWSVVLSFLFPTYGISNVFTAVFVSFLHLGFVYWFFVFSYENNLFRSLIASCMDRRRRKRIVDEMVREYWHEQRQFLLITKPETHKKLYGDFNAIKGVTFHVKTGECFGLLGINGAGKTSTFQMITGENDIDDGDAFICGWSVKTNWRKAGASTGYCPQFDAVLKEMTGEETLYMFARIRGIPRRDIPKKVNAVIHTIGIGLYARRQIKSYSGGNKRRLSLGIALIGLPPVLLLDEPTTGVDPRARRIIWNIFSKVRSLGTALVLTSHSMDECEALCTELAIMVDGKFKCYGSCQHIKSRFGAGFTLLIRLRNCEGVDRIKSEILKKFPGAVLKEHHLLQLAYELPKRKGTTWSGLFDRLEELLRDFDFEDYSLSQTTLEQVFLGFSRNATQPEHNSYSGFTNEVDGKLAHIDKYATRG
ncbi:unnamed protein product [Angiostrongylus costaricensis]|uniref:ABC transporter domain-containing protein n=1 Tax=Angiostrongylus costaricensis TaxID=334426 RepID=A0A0R3PX89_ANGCS|nr:unnamed protein product [Angiostrongylus costaricensis]